MSDVSADPKAIPATAAPEREDAKKGAESASLHRLHKGACGVFGTVLGPEANEGASRPFSLRPRHPPAQRLVPVASSAWTAGVSRPRVEMEEERRRKG